MYRNPFDEAVVNFIGAIVSLFFIGLIIWCIVAFIDWEVSNTMWRVLFLLGVGYGSTLALYHYLKKLL